MLEFNPDSIEVPAGHFINGARSSAGQGLLAVRRPSDGRAYADLPLGTADTVDEAVMAAHKALQASGWARRAPRERAAVLRRWADLMVTHVDELARLEALGSTRPVAEAIACFGNFR